MTVRRKRDNRSWFAAGAGLERALGQLSDAAFKLFVHVCLHAERATGCLEFERGRLARELGKSRSMQIPIESEQPFRLKMNADSDRK